MFVSMCVYVGVPFDVRRLTVGDFTWIAREKATPVPGELGQRPFCFRLSHVTVSPCTCRSAWTPSIKGGCTGAHCREKENG